MLTEGTLAASNPPIPSHSYGNPTLRKVEPYWSALRTYVKGRWMDREILEVLSTEFRDRSVEYYRYALSSGITRVNGEPAYEGYVLRNGDYFENARHRHEPPITSTPVKIIHRDEENGFIVIDKPGSVPVHGVGRYFKNSLVEILKNDFGIEKPYTVNRLDRLTSGIMFIGTTADTARILTDEMQSGSIRKEYVARCVGKFPEDEIIVSQPMLTIDRQMGVNIVHPEGREAKTLFNVMFYDEKSDTSVVHCQPLTGRSHQIRVHLQYIGHPIVNDPIYNDSKVWGSTGGQGGLPVAIERANTTAQEAQTPSINQEPYGVAKGTPSISELIHEPTPLFSSGVGVISGTVEANSQALDSELASELEDQALDPDEILLLRDDAAVPIPLASTSTTCVVPDKQDNSPFGSHIDFIDFEVISSAPESKATDLPKPRGLRNRAKGANTRNRAKPKTSSSTNSLPHLPPPKQYSIASDNDLLPREDGRDIGAASPVPLSEETLQVIKALRNKKDESEEFSRWKDVVFRTKAFVKTQGVDSVSATMRNHIPRHVRNQRRDDAQHGTSTEASHLSNEGNLLVSSSESNSAGVEVDSFPYCEECFLPLYPDPKPSQLYICLHALRYTTSKWSFATEMPFWAVPGWVPDDG